MENKLLDCDLILKGGITSGVVYPKVISTIGERYRLRGLGGTSAGAIAAAFAAAAEYRRQARGETVGFDLVAASGEELNRNLRSLFQPAPALRRLFGLLEGLNKPEPRGRVPRALVAIFGAYDLVALGAAGAVVLAGLVVQAALGGSTAAMIATFLAALIAAVVAVGMAIFRDVKHKLRKADWGLCPGIRQGSDSPPAFGDWIHDKIQSIAGRGPADPPLTVGEIEAPGIDVHIAAMTTDLTSRRPYQLPLDDGHFFRESEFRAVLPAAIVDFMVERGGRYQGEVARGARDLCRMPPRADFPVFLVARMSLSFPGLIASVPLYRPDPSATGGRMVRCLFTDGGLSSNFPIHFFDNVVPGRPTFGFMLGEAAADAGDAPADRILLPGTAGQVDPPLPSAEPNGLASFGWALLGTAKDWQDTLQARLPGYRERTVYILLKETEGGLNLSMPQPVIDRLISYGEAAARTLMTSFDFNRHRRLRASVTLPKMADLIGKLDEKFREAPPDGILPYDALLAQETAEEFSADLGRDWSRDALLPFAERLAGQAHAGVNPDGYFDGIEAVVRLRAMAGKRV